MKMTDRNKNESYSKNYTTRRPIIFAQSGLLNKKNKKKPKGERRLITFKHALNSSGVVRIRSFAIDMQIS